MKTISLKKLTQNGDTIIEVMIALAILGLSLGISYATANGGIQQSVTAQEHSQALGLIDAQVEQLRAAVSSGVSDLPSGYFCMITPAPPSNLPYAVFSTNVPPTALADEQQSPPYKEYPPSPDCVMQSTNSTVNYYVSITPNGSNYGYYTPANSPGETSYTFMVRWDGLGNLGPQQESLTYRIGTSIIPINFPPPVAGAAVSNPIPPIPGADFASCQAYPGGQPPPTDSCHPATNDPTGSLYSFSDYIVSYSLADIPAGTYNISITYENADNGSWPPSGGSYKYSVVASIGSTWSNNLKLPMLPETYSVGSNVTIPANSTITFNWDNNQWVDSSGNGEGTSGPSPGSFDPNLEIDYITFTPN